MGRVKNTRLTDYLWSILFPVQTQKHEITVWGTWAHSLTHIIETKHCITVNLIEICSKSQIKEYFVI